MSWIICIARYNERERLVIVAQSQRIAYAPQSYVADFVHQRLATLAAHQLIDLAPYQDLQKLFESHEALKGLQKFVVYG